MATWKGRRTMWSEFRSCGLDVIWPDQSSELSLNRYFIFHCLKTSTQERKVNCGWYSWNSNPCNDMNPLKIPDPSPSLSSAAIKARYRCLQSHWQPPSPYHPHQAVNMPIGGCWCIASVDHPSCHWQGTKTPMTRVENLATNSSGESEYRAGMSNKVLHISLCQNPLSA